MDCRFNSAKRNLFRKLRRLIGDQRVIEAMEQVPRESFVPPEHRLLAYEDIPLDIGQGQSISQPSIVALMTSALKLSPMDSVLEIGTGSGYQGAILSLLVPDGRVVTVERLPSLARDASDLLNLLGYHNVQVSTPGLTLGCAEQAPFNAIIVAAGSPGLPQCLIDQLAVGGRMIIPIGSVEDQQLAWIMKSSEGISLRFLEPCRFVPLIDKEAWPERY